MNSVDLTKNLFNESRYIMGKSIGDRRQEILDLVNHYGSLDFSQLRERFPGVSDVTRWLPRTDCSACRQASFVIWD